MKYSIYLGQKHGYLSVRGKTEWTLQTAKKHLKSLGEDRYKKFGYYPQIVKSDEPHSNPAPRIGTAKPKRKSQITGKAPSKRLIARRTKNVKKGFFPNPSADVVAAQELRAFIENDANLYRQQFMPIIENIKRKMKAGKYDAAKAPKLWMYLVESGAKKYNKEFGDGTLSLKMFDKPTREHLAHDLSGHYQEAIENGEYGEIGYKKNPTPVKRKAVAKYYLSLNTGQDKWDQLWSPYKTLALAKKAALSLSKRAGRPVKILKEN